MNTMTTYIGTKLIAARPMTRGAYNEYRGWTIPADENPEDEGYLVRYSDSYESWSPKDVFDAAYLPVTNNPNLLVGVPSISQEMVDDFIVKTETETMGEKTTVVRAVLRNGFTIVESSSCASPENYSAELGRQICMDHIETQVWKLLGFLLQTAVNGINYREPVRDPMEGMTFGAALELAKHGCRIARRGWNGKGQYVELADCISYKAVDGCTVNAEHENIGNKALAFVGTSGVQLGWLASQADMLAEDWFLYTTVRENKEGN